MTALLASLGGVDAVIDLDPVTRSGVLTATLGGVAARIAVADDMSVSVYDPSGQVFQAAVVSPSPVYRDVLSGGGVGIATVTMPLDDPAVASITDRSVLKIGFRGDVRGFIVSGEDCDAAVDGVQQLVVSNAPGLLGLLRDGCVYPQGSGIEMDSPDTRLYGVMSSRSIGGWYVPGWAYPEGFLMSDDPTARLGFPKEGGLVASNPYYIAPAPGPAVSQAEGAVVFYQREFTTTEPKYLEFVFTADNYITLWLDNEELITPDYSDPWTWRRALRESLLLPAGPHRIVAQVENARKTHHNNPLGMAGVVYLANSRGDRVGEFLRTDLTHWTCTAGRPGWFPAQVMLQAFKESQAQGDAGTGYLTPTFTPTHDTNGVPWSTGRNPKWEFNVGMPLDQLVTDPTISASGASFDVNARSMTFDGYQRQGTDRSATVHFELGDTGGSLVQYTTSQQSTRFTVAVAKLADGFWHTVEDTAGIAAIGRIVQVVDVGSTSSAEAAVTVMQQMLAQSAQPLVSATAITSSLDGPQMNRAWFKGDTVTTVGHRASGTLRQRVWATNVDGTEDGPPKTWPELVADPTA